MLTIYGTLLCKDCVACIEHFGQQNIAYTFLEIDKSLDNLKAFLSLRDKNKLFDDIKEAGSIGIPCIVDEEGQMTLEWEQFLD